MTNKAEQKQEVKGSPKKANIFIRFLKWISRGSDKFVKKGGGCCS